MYMNYMSSIPSTNHGNDCVFFIVNWFYKMSILAPYKNSVIENSIANKKNQCAWVHFGLPWNIISNIDNRYLSTLWYIMWSLMDTKMRKSIAFHPKIDGHIEVVNRMIVHILQMYKYKNPCTWYEILQYVQKNYKKDILQLYWS